MTKSLLKKVVGGLLIALTLFSCSKDEITDDMAAHSTEEQEFYIKKTIADALNRNTSKMATATTKDEVIAQLDPADIITSPETTYNTRTGIINLEWDKQAFTSDFVKITILIIDFFAFPFTQQVKFDEWVSNNGSYYIDQGENYSIGTGLIKIQTAIEGTGKAVSFSH